MLTQFRWYRRLQGGRWSTVCGMFWGRRWVRVSDACLERIDEDWRR